MHYQRTKEQDLITANKLASTSGRVTALTSLCFFEGHRKPWSTKTLSSRPALSDSRDSHSISLSTACHKEDANHETHQVICWLRVWQSRKGGKLNAEGKEETLDLEASRAARSDCASRVQFPSSKGFTLRWRQKHRGLRKRPEKSKHEEKDTIQQAEREDKGKGKLRISGTNDCLSYESERETRQLERDRQSRKFSISFFLSLSFTTSLTIHVQFRFFHLFPSFLCLPFFFHLSALFLLFHSVLIVAYLPPFASFSYLFTSVSSENLFQLIFWLDWSLPGWLPVHFSFQRCSLWLAFSLLLFFSRLSLTPD